MTTILVIDDDPFIAEILKALLPQEWRILSALDGLDGLDVVRSSMAEGQPPNLLILDIDLPHLDGFDTCILLRNIAPDLTVVPFTNLRDDPRVPKYMTELQCVPPLYKDMPPELLLRSIEAALRRSSAIVPPAHGAVFERLLEKAAEAEALARTRRASRTRIMLYASDAVERLALHPLLCLALGSRMTVVAASGEEVLRTLLGQQPIQVLAAPMADYETVHALSEEFAVPALYIARSLKSATILLAQIEQNAAGSSLVMLNSDFVRTFTAAVQALIGGGSFIDPLIRDTIRQLIEATLARQLFGSLSPRLIELLLLDLLGLTGQEICDYLRITPDSLRTYWRRIGEQLHLKRAEVRSWVQSRVAEHPDLWQICSRFLEDA